MATPESFAQNELILALSEQTFGIESYSMFLKSSTELEATAEIVLLEGIAVEVSLTSRGFQVRWTFGGFCEYHIDAAARNSSRAMSRSMRLLTTHCRLSALCTPRQSSGGSWRSYQR